MAANNTITFYDLALSTGATISPFVWATKYALKHKGFDLDVVPGGFTGILERTGGKTERLPAIVDDGEWVLDSWGIVEYLDAKYPDRPALATALKRLVQAGYPLEGAGDQAVLKEVARKIALHVAGTPTPPLALTEADLDPAAVAKEKKFLTDQAMESGKPLEIAEKMVVGRIRKWQEEVVLLKQPFVMNPDQTIEQLVADTAKQVGSALALKGFVRFALGEGVEKAAGPDFASEVAAMSGQG